MRCRNEVRKPRHLRTGSSRSAFTLIELLLVLVILGILAAIVVPKFAGRSQDAKIAAAKQEVSTLSGALDLFENDNGRYPSPDEGLMALRVAPGNAASWHGPYLNHDVINDPWGNPYVYRYPGTVNTKGFDVFSMGPDGHEGGGDDIGN